LYLDKTFSQSADVPHPSLAGICSPIGADSTYK